MGKTKFKYVVANGKLIIKFQLDATQEEYAKKAYGWTAQIDDPANPGTLIDNDPFPVFWIKYHLNELNDRSQRQYISENSASIVTEAETAIDITAQQDETL
jgi:hypothetical protein